MSAQTTVSPLAHRKKSNFRREFIKNGPLTLFLLPGAVFMVLFCYLPIPGMLIAFKNFTMGGQSFVQNFFLSSWVGFNNFKFMFATNDAIIYIRNTVGYNLLWIVLGLIINVAVAIGVTEIWFRRLSKFFQTTMLLPYFLSWVVVSYFLFALINQQYGVLNNTMTNLGLISQPIQWYNEPKYWPYIMTIANIWKNTGYGSIIYISAIAGLDQELFEAAAIDGATKWQQIKNITLPLLRPMMVILTILALGNIFRGNFDMFFNLPRGSGLVASTTMIIDTYVYKGLQQNFQLGMTAAAGVLQSVVGCVMILAANFVVRRVDPEEALF